MKLSKLACFGFLCLSVSIGLTVSGFFDSEAADAVQSPDIASAGVPWTFGEGERVDVLATNALCFPARSGRWRALRNGMVREHPTCFICGAPTTVIHHMEPYGVDHDGELNRSNLIWYCDRCHLFIGHLGCFGAWNTNCWNDSVEMKWKIVNRADIVLATNRIERTK